jgi:hypothetical protein
VTTTMAFQLLSRKSNPDNTHNAKLASGLNLALRAFILLQVIHSLLFVAISTTQLVSHDFSFGIWGWKLERLVAALLSQVIGVLILRETIADKRRVWGLTLILVIDVACYGFWAWTSEAPLTKTILTAQLVLAPFALVALSQMMRRCGVTVANLLMAAGAGVVASVVVFVRGAYYPVNSPDWFPTPPLYYRLLTYSDFHWPQEKSLALLIVSYLAVSWICELLSRRGEAGTRLSRPWR